MRCSSAEHRARARDTRSGAHTGFVGSAAGRSLGLGSIVKGSAFGDGGLYVGRTIVKAEGLAAATRHRLWVLRNGVGGDFSAAAHFVGLAFVSILDTDQ
jgi:hypothetical protein